MVICRTGGYLEDYKFAKQLVEKRQNYEKIFNYKVKFRELEEAEKLAEKTDNAASWNSPC